MRLGNKKNRIAVIIMICLCINSVHVFAATGLSVTESSTGDTQVVLYLKGVSGDLSKIRVEAGTAVCSDVTACRLTDSSQPVKTLVMLDNSLSIPKAGRTRIRKMIQHMIDSRMEQEEIAIAVFQEGVTWLSDYTSDDAALHQAVTKISYQNSNTYLTDVLYELLSAQKAEQFQDVYRRIVVISDGMDNKSIGYTKDELTALLKEYPVPVYTVGLLTKKKDNQKQLKDLFAISRITEAENHLLTNDQEIAKISQALQADREIVRLTVCPPDELLDGSRKMFKITLDSGERVSVEAVMPQQAKIPEPTAADKDKQTDVDTSDGNEDAQTPDTTDAADTRKSAGGSTWTIVGLAALFLAAAVTAVIVRNKKASLQKASNSSAGKSADSLLHRKSERNFVKKSDETYHQKWNQTFDGDGAETCDTDGDDTKTELMEITETMEDEHTVSMWNPDEDPVCSLVLTDLRIPERSFQIPLQTSVVIGRKQGVCGVVIHDDMSVSGRHCEIKHRDGNFYIQDLQSSNGTCVNGTRIWSETQITSGSVIQMGKSEFRLEIL